MNHCSYLLALCAATFSATAAAQGNPPGSLAEPEKPNIIIILADDMGYGDIGAYNPQSKIPTPNLDRIAAMGVRFTDAHSPSAVCSPTRYALLTGRYAWRSRLKSGVLWGYSPALIESGRPTIATILRENGYRTAAIGKWHLGFGNSEPDFYEPTDTTQANGSASFGSLSPGPNEAGFDYFFGIPASLDMKPYLYVENGTPAPGLNDSVVSASTQRRNGGDGFWRKGLVAEGFEHQEVLPILTERAEQFIHAHAFEDTNKPFFLYFALTAPHTPWLPSDEFKGASGAGYYGDFVVQVDDVVGRINAALLSTGVEENTLLIFTSDNGAHWTAEDINEFSHEANGKLRGQKADIYEGGHRVPFIAKWPSRISEPSISGQLMSLTDLMATFATIIDADIPVGSGEDSTNILSSLLEPNSKELERPAVVHHSLDGMFAIRHGRWKLVEGLGSGGFTEPTRLTRIDDQKYQLFDLVADPGETANLASQHPDVVDQLARMLDDIRASGTSSNSG